MTSHPDASSAGGPPAGAQRACAFLWDESFLWGIMAWRALQEAGLPFDLLRAQEVQQGCLTRYRMLFVPGGWATHKRAALGEKGRGEIRRFVEAGGSYLGICGGAGLATREGLALLPVGRRPSAERVASFSGGIRVLVAGHRIWKGVAAPIFTAWWPSQLALSHPEVRVLATYDKAAPDAFSSDIPVETGERQGWPALEARYGILLDPGRLQGEPAVVEGRCGAGKVILSMLHFDTPGDENGRVVLRNLWQYLAGHSPAEPEASGRHAPAAFRTGGPPDILASLAEIRAAAEGLIAAGEGHGLWRWRTPFLLQWRRGVRGLEYSTLSVMIREIQERLVASGGETARTDAAALTPAAARLLRQELREIQERLPSFAEKARRLLEQERHCLQRGPFSPLRCDDPEVQALRGELFGTAMSHGGAFKPLIDALDRLWLELIRSDLPGRS